jgi:hypothetical protein
LGGFLADGLWIGWFSPAEELPGISVDISTVGGRSKERWWPSRGQGWHEDVNVASGEYDSAKRDDFTRDTLDERSPLEDEFGKIRQFCLDKQHELLPFWTESNGRELTPRAC